MMGLRRLWLTWRWARGWLWLAAAGALLAALQVRVASRHDARVTFLHAEPHALADLMADFSYQPNLGSWAVTGDASNATAWWYAVALSCGARCSGRGVVVAQAVPRGDRPARARDAREHRVALTLETCSKLPVLPWPAFCDEIDMRSVVSEAPGGGALLALRGSARCPVLWAVSSGCAPRLQQHIDAHLMQVRSALHQG